MPPKSSLFTAAALACLLLCVSCGKKQAPDPPAAKPSLLLETYFSLEKGDHKAALNKILRLKEIDKTSVFLAELEAIERNNMYLVETRRLLEAGDSRAAMGILDGALKRHGTIEAIVEAKKSLNALAELSSLLDSINSPKSSSALRASATRLLAIAPDFKFAEPLVPFAESKLRLADDMDRMEAKVTLLGLRFDAETLFQSGSSDAPCLVSELAIEAPKDPALKKLAASLRSASGYRSKTPRK